MALNRSQPRAQPGVAIGQNVMDCWLDYVEVLTLSLCLIGCFLDLFRQSARQGAESFKRYFFGPRGGLESRISQCGFNIWSGRLQARTEHLAALIERHSHCGRQKPRWRWKSWFCQGFEMHDGRMDFRWRGKGFRWQFHDHRGTALPLRQNTKAPIGLCAWLCDNPLSHLFLKHQSQTAPKCWPVFRCQPADQKLGAHVIGQVGHHADRSGELAADVKIQSIGVEHIQTARIGRSNLGQSPMQRGSFSKATTRRAPAAKSPRVKPPGPGPTSKTSWPLISPASLAIFDVMLRSSRKFCPKDFFASNPWEAITSRSGGRSSICILARPYHAICTAYGLNH